MQTTHRPNTVGGIFAFLIFLFLFGLFIGLPVFVWVILVGAFIGLWVATGDQRKAEKENLPPQNDRPWRK
jgi:hypothetical protein